MALINTSETTSWLDNKSQLAQKLRLVLVEELAAVNTYNDLILSIQRMGIALIDGEGKPRQIPDDQMSIEAAKALADKFREIRNDELQHVGKILSVIDVMDPDSHTEVRKGSQGL